MSVNTSRISDRWFMLSSLVVKRSAEEPAVKAIEKTFELRCEVILKYTRVLLFPYLYSSSLILFFVPEVVLHHVIIVDINPR
jgi:hypothetical protein